MTTIEIDAQKTTVGLIFLILAVLGINQYLLVSMNSTIGKGITGQVVGSQTGTAQLEEITAKVIPTGTPEYGQKAGVSFDDVESSLNVLVGYENNIQLEGEDQQRYIKIATTRGTACEFCCGIGERGFGTSEGKIACGCSHNIAFSGLTKWLIKNTDYSDEQIVEEIQKWKASFFPGPAVEKYIRLSGGNPESFGLPSQRGGC